MFLIARSPLKANAGWPCFPITCLTYYLELAYLRWESIEIVIFSRKA